MPAKLPSTSTDGLEWIEVNDFRPGIAQTNSPNHPDGTATETNTYGCIAQSSGALVPLPAANATPLVLPGSAPYTGKTPTSPIYITGVYANDPVFSLDGGNQTVGGPDQVNTELYVALYYWVRGEQSQVNSLTVSGASGGTFTITVDTMTDGVPDGAPQTTSAIAYNASAATVETALEALSNVAPADVACSGGPLNTSAVTITWGGALALKSILVYATWQGTLTGAGSQYASVSVTTGADTKCREIYRRMLNRETPTDQSIYTSTDSTQWFNTVRPRVCDFAATRSNSAAPTLLGPAVIAWVFDSIARFFPDDTATQSMATAAMPTAALVLPAHLCAHQGRAVIFPLTLASIGQLQVYTTTEGFYWTDVNDLTSLSSGLTGYFNVIVSPEIPTGYGVMESLTADELLLIKAKGGALLLRGSLDDYSAKSLPNVKSTGQSLNRGCRSPVGFIYPVDGGGVWLWGGGDTSQHISPNMDPEFWRPDYSDADLHPFGPGYTTCAQWQEWVLLPNNWIWDSDFGGFWRIDEIADIDDGADPPVVVGSTAVAHWAVDWKGRHAYGFLDRMCDDGTNEIIGYDYDMLDKRSSFSWQSQPFAATIDRHVKVRKFVLVASGTGTATVTVTTERGSSSLSFTISATDTSPLAYMKNVSLVGTHVRVRIVSTGSGGGDAPTIHGFRIGLDEDTGLTNGSS